MDLTVDVDEMDLTGAESKATYEEIKKYVAEHNDGMKVTNLYIAQVRRSAALLRGRTIICLNQGMRSSHSVRRIRKRRLRMR